jgi:SAM-dependent methyltransferase
MAFEKMSTNFDYAGEREYYAETVTQIRSWRWIAQDMVHWVPGFPEVFKHRCVLDVGAGECLVTFNIAERGKAKCTVGLELILHRMQAARQVDLPGLQLVCGDCFNLPFGRKSFDVVIGNGVLHHLPDEGAAVGEIARVLRPGGVYFGREPNFRNPLVKRRVLGGHHTPNEHAVMPATIRHAFTTHGFDVQIRPFWRRIPWLHHPWFSVSIAIEAKKVRA